MSPNPYKISVDLTSGLFEAEGDSESAREDYRLFLDAAKAIAIAKVGAAPPAPGAPAPAPPGSTLPAGNGAGAAPAAAAGDLDVATLQRAFLIRDNVVTLLALPQGDDAVLNAVIALIYGFAKVGNVTPVSALALAKALRLSGLDRERIDRDLGTAVGTIITKAGAARGMKYGLTNTGMRRAEDIVRAMLA